MFAVVAYVGFGSTEYYAFCLKMGQFSTFGDGVRRQSWYNVAVK